MPHDTFTNDDIRRVREDSGDEWDNESNDAPSDIQTPPRSQTPTQQDLQPLGTIRITAPNGRQYDVANRLHEQMLERRAAMDDFGGSWATNPAIDHPWPGMDDFFDPSASFTDPGPSAAIRQGEVARRVTAWLDTLPTRTVEAQPILEQDSDSEETEQQDPDFDVFEQCPYEVGTVVSTLPCGHHYNKGELTTYFTITKAACPECRQDYTAMIETNTLPTASPQANPRPAPQPAPRPAPQPPAAPLQLGDSSYE